MPYYRKKPVVIEAVQFTGDNAADVALWMGNVGAEIVDSHDHAGVHPVIEIDTLEGTLTVSPGDWIIKGVKGEYYPVRPDIFAATYELA